MVEGWNDLHEMVTASCYSPDGQVAMVGSHKGSCHLFDTTDSPIGVVNGDELVHKFKGNFSFSSHWFLSTRSQMSACVAPKGKYVVCGSEEDSGVYVWDLET